MTSNDGGYYPPPGGQPWGGPQGPPPGYPAHPGYPQQPPPKGKSRWPWIIGAGVLVLVLVAVLGLVVINAGGDGDEQALQRTVITYEVTGAAGSVELSYWGTEGQQPPTTVPLPWRATVTLEGQDAYFDVSARTAEEPDGELACRVIANGKAIAEERTVGEFVGCGGRLNEQ
ncbi:MmpS family transport accessory protein [Mycobacterium sp. ITM-2016-00316]|uniref:MmpS family transport accessory protein n=1 Tax=Mycobacterium sp. ITM-2016-00316 TaxID=2099695 RepID=UPI000CF8F71B|nr:MmpS family transport accessory protein [Mycobacterium sp. ITM-2016-00316]WNG81233.1 MmpS family transport accessory protein [Mycobacterium sp. ITM-2016-00316]